VVVPETPGIEIMKAPLIPILLLILHPDAIAGEWIEPPARTASGFPVPVPDRRPEPPAAHGAHREYMIEWWYWVGHLTTQDGEPLGFQSTVFRRAADPGDDGEPDASAFGKRHLFLAHGALSEIGRGEFVHEQQLYREGWQARAETGRLGLRVGMIAASEADGGFDLTMRLEGGRKLSLRLKPEKPMVAFGERGLSRKGADPASVSWYWTYTRLGATGTLERDGRVVSVSGLAWMDHEISSSQLSAGLAGWDWTCMHLDDGSEVKAYRLRTEDGGSDPWSAVYWINADGEARSVYAKAMIWNEDSWWTSPGTGVRYPTAVTITATDPADGEKRVYQLRPRLAGQELGSSAEANPYWEGACEVLDERGKRLGLAYLELAGYGGGLGAQLGGAAE
jgi:predicted secreted hydrolase